MGDVNLEIKLKNIQEKTDIIDVDNAGDGQVLTYNSVNDKFEPKTPTGGSGIITSVSNNFNVDNGKLDLSNEFKTVVNNKADLDDLADIFGSKSTPYVKGDMCIYDNVIYINEYGTTSNTVFVPEHWTATKISHVISTLNTNLPFNVFSKVTKSGKVTTSAWASPISKVNNTITLQKGIYLVSVEINSDFDYLQVGIQSSRQGRFSVRTGRIGNANTKSSSEFFCVSEIIKVDENEIIAPWTWCNLADEELDYTIIATRIN